MARFHLVRVGALAQVGRFRADDERSYPRGTRVVVRTARGLELGEVLVPPDEEAPPDVADGALLRAMTVEDELLAARLERNREAAYTACVAQIETLGLATVLMDVEHLFDGRTLAFYFLGDLAAEDPSGRLNQSIEQLAEAYEAQAQTRRFAETLTAGCGPGCGTEQAAGQGCTSCATGCAVAGACHTAK